MRIVKEPYQMTTVELYELTRTINAEWEVRAHYNPKNKRWDG